MAKIQQTILIVDDSPEDCSMFQRYLNQDPDYTYCFSQEETGEAGLAACHRQLPDCILLDYNLPDMDGLEFMTELSKQVDSNGVACVMLTGQGTEAIAVQAMKYGAKDYLVKNNTSPEYLQRAVHNAIEKALLFRQLQQQRLELERSNRELEVYAEEKRQQAVTAQAAQKTAETEQKRAVLLSDASSILSSSLNYQSTLARFAHLVTQSFADWCTIDLVGEQGRFQRVEVASADPNRQEMAESLKQSYAPDPYGKAGIPRVVRTGIAEMITGMNSEVRKTLAMDEIHLQMLEKMNGQSLMIVPINIREQVIGTISFVSCNPTDYYQPEDLKLAEELARRAALAVDNARLYQETQKAIQARNELLSMVSHDLKNPLAAIKGFVDLMRRRLKRTEPAEREWLEEGFDRINSSVKRMTGLLNELLDLAHLQLGRPLDLEIHEVDLVHLARQRMTERPELMSQHHLQLETHETTLVGSWDPTRLERVLDNLLSNAIKYSPKGGPITVRLQRETLGDEQWAMLTVSDKGLGIPAADLPYIFERFHRAKNVGQISGTGIGLASVYQIIEQHGGTISASSQEGTGTTFTVRLPLSRQVDNQEPPDSTKTPLVGV